MKNNIGIWKIFDNGYLIDLHVFQYLQHDLTGSRKLCLSFCFSVRDRELTLSRYRVYIGSPWTIFLKI